MSIELNLISGIMLGAEYVFDPEEEVNYLVVDILFVRVLFGWT